MYTSGTSGDPKGVVLTHETIAFSVRGIDLFLEQFEDKVTMILNLTYFPLLMHTLWRLVVLDFVPFACMSVRFLCLLALAL